MLTEISIASEKLLEEKQLMAKNQIIDILIYIK